MFRRYTSLIAFFLLLIFVQGAGMRLWMHNWFHQSSTVRSSPLANTHEVRFTCDCLQDALMPLEPASPIELVVPEETHAARHAEPGIPFPAFDKPFYSLKGPPVVLPSL